MSIKIGNKRKGDVGEYVGRPSPLGNPFVVGRDGTREQVVALYREWLRERMRQRDSAVIRELQQLYLKWEREGQLTLVCWCAPHACHAHVIRDVLMWRKARSKRIRKREGK